MLLLPAKQRAVPITVEKKRRQKPLLLCLVMWGFSKIRGTFLGVPIIKARVFEGLYWGPPYVGRLPCIDCTGAPFAAFMDSGVCDFV